MKNSESEREVAQLCLTLCDPEDCKLSGSSVHGIFQARVLEWVAISFSMGSSQPRDQTQTSHIAGRRVTVWKILKEMGIPEHLTCLLRNLYAGQEATARTGHGTQTVSKLGKEYVKAVYCHPAYLTYMQSISCKMPGWLKHKLEAILPGEISITSEMQMTPPLWQKAKN